jgi:microcystin-dependent protein
MPRIESNITSGTIYKFAGASAPDGFLLCQGQAVSRTTFATLFTAIGTTFGVGDGSTTFNVPNFQGRTAVGAGTYSDSVLGSTTRTLGQSLGAAAHSLGTSEIPSHNHPGSTFADHTHGQVVSANPNTGGSGIRLDYGGDFTGLNAFPQGINTGGASNTSVSVASQGGSGTHNNMQPSLVVHYIIKV